MLTYFMMRALKNKDTKLFVSPVQDPHFAISYGKSCPIAR